MKQLQFLPIKFSFDMPIILQKLSFTLYIIPRLPKFPDAATQKNKKNKK